MAYVKSVVPRVAPKCEPLQQFIRKLTILLSDRDLINSKI